MNLLTVSNDKNNQSLREVHYKVTIFEKRDFLTWHALSALW